MFQIDLWILIPIAGLMILAAWRIFSFMRKKFGERSSRKSANGGVVKPIPLLEGESTLSSASPAPETDKILRSIDKSLGEIAASIGSITTVLDRAERLLVKAIEPSEMKRPASGPELDRMSHGETSLTDSSADLIISPSPDPRMSDEEALRLANRLIEHRGSYRGPELSSFRVVTKTQAGFTLGGPALESPDSDLIGQRSVGMNIVVIPGFLVAKNAGTRVNPVLSGDLGSTFDYQRGARFRLLACASLTGDSSLLQISSKGVIEGPSHSDP